MYPPIAAQLADLLGRIDANDRQVEFINEHARPMDAEPLLVAELVARKLPSFSVNGAIVPRITRRLVLSAFDYSPFDLNAWPPQR